MKCCFLWIACYNGFILEQNKRGALKAPLDLNILISHLPNYNVDLIRCYSR